jgi:uncharacterized caspase-like protein
MDCKRLRALAFPVHWFYSARATRRSTRRNCIAPAILIAMAVACASLSLATNLSAKERRALVVGVSDYGKSSGIAKLNAPVYDAEMVKLALERLKHPFMVDMLTNDDVKDKEAFNAALNRFLEKVHDGDEVIFYFSGHGYNIDPSMASAGRGGNYYLLPSAKSRDAYVKDLPTADSRGLDTDEKKQRAYAEWISTVALPEKAIEETIHSHRPDTVVMIADACRSLIEGTKGASLISGVVLPSDKARGTFRLYSASQGEVSLDSLDPIEMLDVNGKPVGVDKSSLGKGASITPLWVGR